MNVYPKYLLQRKTARTPYHWEPEDRHAQPGQALAAWCTPRHLSCKHAGGQAPLYFYDPLPKEELSRERSRVRRRRQFATQPERLPSQTLSFPGPAHTAHEAIQSALLGIWANCSMVCQSGCYTVPQLKMVTTINSVTW